MLLRKLHKRKPQYREILTKEACIEVKNNDENQCLGIPGSPVPTSHHNQYFNAQINELKKLNNGIHHHKSFVSGYSSCHNFLFWN